MSRITHQPTPNTASDTRPNLATPGVLPSPSVTPTDALEALLQSPPNHARPPKQPERSEAPPQDVAKLDRDLTSLGKQIDKKTVEDTLNNPKSGATTELVDKIDTVLSKENIDTLLRSPHAQACKKTLNEIGSHLNKEAIDAALSPLEQEQIDNYRKQVEHELFNLSYKLSNTSVGSRFDLIRRFANNKPGTLMDIESRLTNMGNKSAFLLNIATEVKKVNEALQYAHLEGWDRHRHEPDSVPQPNIYRYLSTRESTLEAPSEIRDFVHGRDKLDVSGIRKQLRTKLQWVNQLSGASGEMQLKYSPTHDASVLVIAGDKGEPAFVAKIFGKLKETDLVT